MEDPNPATPVEATQLQEVIQQVQQPPAIKTPVRIETKTGQVYEGATQEEVLQKVVNAQESATTHIREQKEELERLRREVQQRETPAPQPQGQKSPQDTYFEIWQKDPIAADRYAESVRLGVPLDQVDAIQRSTVQGAAAAQINQAGNEFFRRCPDYAPTPENSELMAQTIKQKWGNIAPTADHLELTFNDLVRSGKIIPADIPISALQNGVTPLPTAGGSMQAPTVDFERQFRQLTAEQQKKVIEELAARGRK